MAWYEHPIIFYDWARHREALTPEYARWVVQKALDLNADTLAFCVQVGGYALWNSEVSPRAAQIGEMDLVGELSRLCKKSKLRFVPWWLGTAGGVERVLREHPSWQLVGPPVPGATSGSKDGAAGDQGKKHWYICYNTPYRELLYEEVREVIARYDVDGIYFDQLPGSCYCAWCQKKFERLYGQPMPEVPDEFFVYNSAAGLPPRLREFRDRCVVSFCAGIRKIIDETKPEIIYAQNWIRNQQAYLAKGTVDVLLPEFYQRDDLIPLGLKHRLTKTYFDHGPIWGNVRHSVRHDARHNPVQGTRLLLFECVANLAAPLLLDLGAMDFDQTGKEELAATFGHIRAVQEILAEARPVRHAALLHSRRSHELFPERFDEAFEGMYRLLLENHVPFEIVSEEGVQRGELKEYKVLIVPDAVALADETVTQVRRAVENGAGLVATYMTGTMNESGSRRQQPAFADLFDIELKDVVAYEDVGETGHDPVLGFSEQDGPILRYGSVNPDHPLAEGLPGKGFFCFRGGFAVFECGADSQEIARIHTVDFAGLSARPFNRRGVNPGPARWPLAAVRRRGKGRVAYFAPQADAGWRRAHAPELEALLLRAIRWAGGPPPLEAPDCPPPVEVRLFRSAKRRVFQILLTNLATNAFYREVWPGVIRYVIPHKGLRLNLRTKVKVKKASSLLGAKVEYSAKGGSIQLELSALDLYDSILLEY